ncbi:MAG: Fe2+-dependent dioxygenase [Janthinobacterium lividum]
MLIEVPEVLSKDQVRRFRKALDEADWIDGKVTAGFQSGRVKDNLQLAEDHPVALELGREILAAVEQTPLFVAAALPSKIFPPLFNRYEGGQAFGNHVDGSVRRNARTGAYVRTDLSVTLFLSEPEEYTGGELVIEDTYGEQQVKLPAGSLILYPSTSLHRVEPVSQGARICSFFWLQSMVRTDAHRSLLLTLDVAIQSLNKDAAGHKSILELTGLYHNLLREWVEV